MRNALPMLLIAVVGAIWLAARRRRSTLVAGLGRAGDQHPWTLHAMKTYRYQNLEAPFAVAITTGESREGRRT